MICDIIGIKISMMYDALYAIPRRRGYALVKQSTLNGERAVLSLAAIAVSLRHAAPREAYLEDERANHCMFCLGGQAP